MDSLTEDITDCVKQMRYLEREASKIETALQQVRTDLVSVQRVYLRLQEQKRLLSEQQPRGDAEECTG